MQKWYKHINIEYFLIVLQNWYSHLNIKYLLIVLQNDKYYLQCSENGISISL